ncbi:VOC family protein [Pseudoruegeria sp. SHC-113]|uniref:VOC family protein n=1 Tax=Pseudoruegeria sp. SHC-113 TaxID=2855439 RepID=UPI0021BB4750|nr:VOC family protein [Pseudoruegeria sp. SHC-113]MCT8160771.1 VOC family protein [Pseudoruegeria sp. SHC-113]
MMLNYAVFGTDDLAAAGAFYDALFEGEGLSRLMPSERMIYWLGEGFAFAVARPFDGAAASNGNGTMIGFALDSEAKVRLLHGRALELGGTCEGAPGPRGPKYSAYVRDPDGNKLCFAC